MTERNKMKEVRYTKETKCACGEVIKSMPIKFGAKALTICNNCGEFVELEIKK